MPPLYVPLPPGRLVQPVYIDPGTPLAGAASYTSPTWAAGAYRWIRIYLKATQSSNSYQRIQMNADSAATYTDMNRTANGASGTSGTDCANNGANGFARVGILNTAGTPGEGFIWVEFDPRTDGKPRSGKHTSSWYANTGTAASHSSYDGTFFYNNSVTDITFVTLSTGGPTWTGAVEIQGVPA